MWHKTQRAVDPPVFGERSAAWRLTVSVITACNLIVLGLVTVPQFAAVHDAPELVLDDPARALFAVADARRRGVQSAYDWEPTWWNRCDVCSPKDLEQAWSHLEQRAGEPQSADAASLRSVARAAALASWGQQSARQQLEALDPEEVSELPAYLKPRVEELRAGTYASQERARTETVSERNTLGLVLAAFTMVLSLAGLGIFFRRPSGLTVNNVALRVPLITALVILVWSFGLAYGGWPLLASVFGVGPLGWSLLLAIPALYLTYLAVLAPAGLGFWQVFGVPSRPGVWRWVLGAAFVGFGMDLWWSQITDYLVHRLGIAWAWTDVVDEQLFYGSVGAALETVVVTVVCAPLLEELLFRGVLYTALRRRFPVVVALLLQTLVFTALHIYSVPGMVTVAGAGIVFALLYEKTGSLVPGMCAHALANVAAVLSTLSMR